MENKVKHLFQMCVLHRHFTAPVCVFFLLSTFLYYNLGNSQIHLYINQNFTSTQFDLFFVGITELGNAAVIFVLLPFVLIMDINLAVRLLSAFLLCTLVIWLCKFFLFADALRPVAAITDGYEQLRLVSGIKMNRIRTFPSGHASTIFTIICCFAFSTKSNITKVVLFVMAFIVASSRVYLSQHFMQDMAAGALIGTFCTLVIFTWQSKYSFYWKTGRKKHFQYMAVDVKK